MFVCDQVEARRRDFLPDFTHKSRLAKVCTNLHWLVTVGIARRHKNVLVCEGRRCKSAIAWGIKQNCLRRIGTQLGSVYFLSIQTCCQQPMKHRGNSIRSRREVGGISKRWGTGRGGDWRQSKHEPQKWRRGGWSCGSRTSAYVMLVEVHNTTGQIKNVSLVRVLCVQLGLVGLTNRVVCDSSSGVVKFVIPCLSVDIWKSDETSLFSLYT